jgi:hypothetical protein
VIGPGFDEVAIETASFLRPTWLAVGPPAAVECRSGSRRQILIDFGESRI